MIIDIAKIEIINNIFLAFDTFVCLIFIYSLPTHHEMDFQKLHRLIIDLHRSTYIRQRQAQIFEFF